MWAGRGLQAAGCTGQSPLLPILAYCNVPGKNYRYDSRENYHENLTAWRKAVSMAGRVGADLSGLKAWAALIPRPRLLVGIGRVEDTSLLQAIADELQADGQPFAVEPAGHGQAAGGAQV